MCKKKEQESICVRYVDDDMNVHEEFLGFYQVDDTTGKDLASTISTIKDALLRYGIPLDRLRGMSFDGAANMPGCYNGAQALLRQEQPQAVFVHCGAHSVNLAGKDAFGTSMLFTHALQTVNEVGTLFSDSTTKRNKFRDHSRETPGQICQGRYICVWSRSRGT